MPKKSVAEIVYGFVEVSQTERIVTLVGFDGDLSKKYIPIKDISTEINLKNISLIDDLKKIRLLHRDTNYLLSASNYCEFSVVIHDVSQCHVVKQYIRDG